MINESQVSINKPNAIHIESNLDSIEQRILELRTKRQEENRSILEQQERLTRKINKVVDQQKNRSVIKEDDIEEDVKLGIEARLNITTRKNLELKEQNKELNDIVYQKNAHIAKIMKRMRELEARNDELERKNQELQTLVDSQYSQIKDGKAPRHPGKVTDSRLGYPQPQGRVSKLISSNL